MKVEARVVHGAHEHVEQYECWPSHIEVTGRATSFMLYFQFNPPVVDGFKTKPSESDHKLYNAFIERFTEDFKVINTVGMDTMTMFTLPKRVPHGELYAYFRSTLLIEKLKL